MDALELRHLHKSYRSVPAVRGLDLRVAKGELVALLGPNGTGKTTTIHVATGLLRPSSGTVRLFGEGGPGERRLRARLGVCPQENVVHLELTVRENLLHAAALYHVARSERGSAADRWMDRLGLVEKKDARARTLSGGMQRRLTLAMALVHEPELVFLDEPGAGLDPQSRVVVREVIRGLRRDRAVLLTTHDMDEADRVADRVVVMDHGRAVAVGTPDELKRLHGGGGSVLVRLSAGDPLRVAVRLAPRQATVVDGGVLVGGAEATEDLAGLLAAVAAAGGHVDHVDVRRPSLEDVFLALTGRRLRG